LLPEIPTIAEAGVPGYEILIWNGLVTPAATPQPIITRLHRELTQILNTQGVTELLAGDGSRPLIESPQTFAAFLKKEMTKWTQVVRQAGITAE
jgi:tripartite-type tricarboxylate transporter receptor subunit TctC